MEEHEKEGPLDRPADYRDALSPDAQTARRQEARKKANAKMADGES